MEPFDPLRETHGMPTNKSPRYSPDTSGTYEDDILRMNSVNSTGVEASWGIRNPQIGLVVGVEYDRTHPRMHPATLFDRELVFVQWTMKVSFCFIQSNKRRLMA